jgi:hypothetical protein
MSGDIILVVMLLRNFVINEREGDKDADEAGFFERFYILDEHEEKLLAKTGERPSAIVSDNNEQRPSGCQVWRFDKEEELEKLGEEV